MSSGLDKRQTFIDTRGKTAWHRLDRFEYLRKMRDNDPDTFATYGIDIPDQRPTSAVENYKLLGNPEYSIYKLKYERPNVDPATGIIEVDNDGNPVTEMVEYRDGIVIRHPVFDDPYFREIGTVGENYHLIAGQKLVETWDSQIGLDVETIMLLNGDKILVVTGGLPSTEVAGRDAIDNYLVLRNGYNGKVGMRASVTSTRVVCRNTLSIGEAMAAHHSEGSFDVIVAYMKDVVERAKMQVDVMTEAFNILANTPATMEQAQEMAQTMWPTPRKPDMNFGYVDTEKTAAQYRNTAKRMERHRAVFMANFQGDAMGFGDDGNPTNQTLWHLLNSHTEILTHASANTLNKDGVMRQSNPDEIARNLLVGFRERQIRQATQYVIELAPDAANLVAERL